MNKYTEFKKWYEEYFCNTQGDDSPYSYNDVKIAYYSGWKKHKEDILSKPKMKSTDFHFKARKLCIIKGCLKPIQWVTEDEDIGLCWEHYKELEENEKINR